MQNTAQLIAFLAFLVKNIKKYKIIFDWQGDDLSEKFVETILLEISPLTSSSFSIKRIEKSSKKSSIKRYVIVFTTSVGKLFQ